MPIINKTKWGRLKLYLPKNEQEQIHIVQLLDEFSRLTRVLVEEYLLKLTDLEELKKSILQKAFQGELTSKEVVS